MERITTFNDYCDKAMRTANKNLNDIQMREHALFGLCGEVGELHSIYQKAHQGHPVSQEHVRKEVGDILWMLNEFCVSCGFSMEDSANENIEKLAARYSNGFSAKESLNRKEGDI